MSNTVTKIMQNEQPYYVGDIGSPLLSIAWSMIGSEDGYLDLSKDRGLLLRSAFPDAWNRINTLSTSGVLVDEATWQAEKTANGGTCAKFSAGDGATNFRVPVLSKVVTASTGTGSPTGSFSNMQGAAGSSNIIGAVFMYPMMKMYSRVSEGSYANIGALIEATTGKIDSSELIILHNNLNLYLNADTGNDSNDGLSSDKALQTWTAMHDLLSKINPRRYIVTVNISGIQPGDATFALPQYSSANLKLLGTSTATDGFAGLFFMTDGGLEPHLLQFGQLHTADKASIVSYSGDAKIVRITGLSSPTSTFRADIGSRMSFYNVTFEYSGAFTTLVRVYDAAIHFLECVFTPIGSPTFTTASDIIFNRGGEFFCDVLTVLPNGGTIARANPSNLNALGCAVAVVRCSSDGTPTYGFNYTSVAKVSVGVYDITIKGSASIAIAGFVQGSGQFRGEGGSIRATPTNPTLVRVEAFDDAGAVADVPFMCLVF